MSRQLGILSRSSRGNELWSMNSMTIALSGKQTAESWIDIWNSTYGITTNHSDIKIAIENDVEIFECT